MYAPGSLVVYRHHVCEVAAVREDYYDGKDYLELHALFQNSLKLFVSAEEAHLPTLRPVMTKKEALALVDSIADADGIDENSFELGANTPTVLERRVREEYDRRLKTFAPEDLVPIMKSVHERTVRREGAGARSRPTDKKYFDLAEGLLCDELSVSLGIPRENVKDFLVERVKQVEAKRRAAFLNARRTRRNEAVPRPRHASLLVERLFQHFLQDLRMRTAGAGGRADEGNRPLVAVTVEELLDGVALAQVVPIGGRVRVPVDVAMDVALEQGGSRREQEVVLVFRAGEPLHEIGQIVALREPCQLVRVLQPHVEGQIDLPFLQAAEEFRGRGLVGADRMDVHGTKLLPQRRMLLYRRPA